MPITVYSKNECDVFLAQQTGAWGTTVADNATYAAASGPYLMDVEVAVIDPDFKERRPNRSQSGSRILREENIQIDSKGSTPKMGIKGDVKVGDLPHLLYAVMQKVVEAGTAGNPKTFTFPATQPDFTAYAGVASAGWIGTLWEKHPVASLSARIFDAIASEITLTCSPDAGDGRMQVAETFISRQPASLTANPTVTTWVRTAQSFYYFHDINVCTVFSGTTLPLIPLGLELKISLNGLKVVSTNLSGIPLTFAIPEYVATMKLKVAWEAGATEARASWGTSANRLFTIRWGTPATLGYLNIALQGELLKMTNAPDNINAIEIEAQAVKVGTGQPLTISLCDSTARGWPTS